MRILDSLEDTKVIRKNNLDEATGKNNVSKQPKLKKQSISASLNIIRKELKLNIEEQQNISPYIVDFINKYFGIDWMEDYLKKTLDISGLFFWKLDKNREFKEIIISSGRFPKIVYKYQNNCIGKEDLDSETKRYRDRGISCRWFFGQEGNNKTSENWSYQLYGEYCYLVEDSNSVVVKAYRLLPNNSVGLPLDPHEEGTIIRNTMK